MCSFFKTYFRIDTSDRKQRFDLSETIFELKKYGIPKEGLQPRLAIVSLLFANSGKTENDRNVKY